ncbi:ubiquitin domain-containing protein UBFD1 isoform X2 [Anabrus simplex]|uniref:ubiquitin domain-containing protein UBFD1 isoform X2 n=1 Tax=Anabrus simplex TaxID=316456 RepID=UPI0034DCF752
MECVAASGKGDGESCEASVAAESVVEIEKIESSPKVPTEFVDFKVIYNKTKYDISFELDNTVGQLKQHLQDVIGVPQSMQKVMIKGLARDERTLRELGVVKGAKVMVVGSKLDDVLAVSTPSKQDSLPPFPLSGMLNKSGGKVRLTFKMEQDQVWIGTKERTDKIPMNSIKSVVSEPIEGHEEYHIMGIQLGPTEASRYWVYWVPAQYIDAIKDAILGKWQYF